jgi:Flp pilus assembly protein TadG
MKRQHEHERGVALVAVAIFFAVLLGITAIGVDLGRLAHTSTEVQAVADAAATAGAIALNKRNGVAGGSLPDAHVVSGDNMMNGSLAPDANVDIVEGNYNFATATFTAGGAKRAAVKATAHTPVTNLFAGIFDFINNGRLQGTPKGTDFKHTTVARVSIAGFAGKGSGCSAPQGCSATDVNCWCQRGAAPCLPIAIPSCKFDTVVEQGLVVTPSTSDNAAWTTFDDVASTAKLLPLFPSPCGSGAIQEQDAFNGNTINLNNGIASQSQNGPYGAMECVYNHVPPLGCRDDDNDGVFDGAGGQIFTVPVFDLATCTTNMNQTRTVVGFATIVLSGADHTVPIVTLSSIQHVDTSGDLGGGNFGTGRVTMVQ